MSLLVQAKGRITDMGNIAFNLGGLLSFIPFADDTYLFRSGKDIKKLESTVNPMSKNGLS